MFGLQNGVIYALVALGYTLVYGIIELINFAHGDLFMLGTLLSATIISRWFSTPDGCAGLGDRGDRRGAAWHSAQPSTS